LNERETKKKIHQNVSGKKNLTREKGRHGRGLTGDYGRVGKKAWAVEKSEKHWELA